VATVATYANQTDIQQDAEVFGYGGLFDAQRLNDVADRSFPGCEVVQDVPAAWFRDGVEGVGSSGGTGHKFNIYSYMGICQEIF